jgi:hypothetical protein
LNAAGEAELTRLKACLANMGGDATSLKHDHGGEFRSAKLPPDAKETMDCVTSEWVVDEDQGFNAPSRPGFRRMMSTATNGKYDGCCAQTVARVTSWPWGWMKNRSALGSTRSCCVRV